MMTAFIKAKPILQKIEKAGFEAFYVGGAVRDSLLGKKIDDVDIASSATPEEIKRIFGKTIDVGIKHGTVVIIWDNSSYEITTFRSESEYINNRRPSEVLFIRSLKEDLKRRDFTMNAIAMDKEGKLIDYFNGIQAIEQKIIKTVGNPKERFTEDALRMMRAVRFVSQLSFTLEENTYQAICSFRHLLSNISIERKTSEFEKILQGKNRLKAIQIIIQTKLYEHFPGMINHEQSLTKIVGLNCAELSSNEMWTLLLYQMEISKKENVNKLLKLWKLPGKKIKTIEKLLFWLNYRMNHEWTKESIYNAKLENVVSVERIHNVLLLHPVDYNLDNLAHLYNYLYIKDRSELHVTGNDLIEWRQCAGGAWVKQVLIDIENAILLGKLKNEKDSIREWLHKWNPK